MVRTVVCLCCNDLGMVLSSGIVILLACAVDVVVDGDGVAGDDCDCNGGGYFK